MDLVVESEREPLQLLKKIQAIAVGDLLADPLGLIVGGHGEEPPHGRRGHHQHSGDQELAAQDGGVGMDHAQASGQVHRPTQQARQGEAGESRAQGCGHRHTDTGRRRSDRRGHDAADHTRHGPDVDDAKISGRGHARGRARNIGHGRISSEG